MFESSTEVKPGSEVGGRSSCSVSVLILDQFVVQTGRMGQHQHQDESRRRALVLRLFLVFPTETPWSRPPEDVLLPSCQTNFVLPLKPSWTLWTCRFPEILLSNHENKHTNRKPRSEKSLHLSGLFKNKTPLRLGPDLHPSHESFSWTFSSK